MWTRHRHRWLNALAVLFLAASVPLLQGAGLHLHLGEDAHGPYLHGAQGSGHAHHHDGADDVDLTPQATGNSGAAADIVFVASLPRMPGTPIVYLRQSPPSRSLLPHFKPPPAWLTRPLRGPPV